MQTERFNGVTFGSTDGSAFTYDPNTGRMKNYTHTVATSATRTGYNSGTLTWNANGTLQQLAITDTLNPADTQTCNYLYDDLARITSANCGSGEIRGKSGGNPGTDGKSGDRRDVFWYCLDGATARSWLD